MEQDKQKLSEKWIRLSARQKVDERNKSKQRGHEVKLETIEKELNQFKTKSENFERENQRIKDENKEQKTKIHQ